MGNTIDVGKAHQRIIRESKEKTDSGGLFGYPIPNIKEAVCKQISYATAEKIILEYEWLGTMGQGQYCYGIFFEGYLGGGCMLRVAVINNRWRHLRGKIQGYCHLP